MTAGEYPLVVSVSEDGIIKKKDFTLRILGEDEGEPNIGEPTMRVFNGMTFSVPNDCKFEEDSSSYAPIIRLYLPNDDGYDYIGLMVRPKQSKTLQEIASDNYALLVSDDKYTVTTEFDKAEQSGGYYEFKYTDQNGSPYIERIDDKTTYDLVFSGDCFFQVYSDNDDTENVLYSTVRKSITFTKLDNGYSIVGNDSTSASIHVGLDGVSASGSCNAGLGTVVFLSLIFVALRSLKK